MAHEPAEKLSPHEKSIMNCKGTSRILHVRNVDSKNYVFSVTLPFQGFALSSIPAAIVVLSEMSLTRGLRG